MKLLARLVEWLIEVVYDMGHQKHPRKLRKQGNVEYQSKHKTRTNGWGIYGESGFNIVCSVHVLSLRKRSTSYLRISVKCRNKL